MSAQATPAPSGARTERAVAALLKLSGMAYHGGKPAEHWLALVGIDPREVSGIQVGPSGLCYWTPRAESICQAHWRAVRRNWNALGVPA